MKKRKKGLTISQRENLWGFAFITPCVLIFAVFTIYPMNDTIYLINMINIFEGGTLCILVNIHIYSNL